MGVLVGKGAGDYKWSDIFADLCSYPECPTSIEALRTLYRRNFGSLSNVKINKIYEDTNVVQPQTLEEAERTVSVAREAKERLSIVQKETTVKIITPHPICLTSIADVHLGAPGFADKVFFEHIRAIRDNAKYVHVMLGGDLCEFQLPMFRDATAVMEQTISPQQQIATMEGIVDEIETQVIARCGGNHDTHDEKITGVSAKYFTDKERTFPFMPEGGVVNLKINDQLYRIIWKHKWRGQGSKVNDFLGHYYLRLDHRNLGQFDIALLEHIHEPRMKSSKYGIDIQSGTYKVSDRYSRSGWQDGSIAPQTVILHHDHHEVEGVHGEQSLYRAIDILKNQE